MSDPYFYNSICYDRLLKEYKKHGNLIVGFDFDDTIYDYHKKGFKYKKVISLLVKCCNLGFIMIMCSCKEKQEELEKNKIICRKLGVRVDYINFSPIFPKADKPFVNIYLDDKAGLKQSYEILNQIVLQIKKQKAGMK